MRQLFSFFLFFLPGLSPLPPLKDAKAVSLSVWTYEKNKAKEAQKAREAVYSHAYPPYSVYDYREIEDEDEDDEKESETVIESTTLEGGEQVLRVKNGPNERQTITTKNEDGTVREITKTLSSRSRSFKQPKNPAYVSGGNFNYNPPPKKPEDEEPQTDTKPLVPLNPPNQDASNPMANALKHVLV